MNAEYERGFRAGIEEAAKKATSFLVGDPANGIPLRSPSPHQIADAIRALAPAAPESALEASQFERVQEELKEGRGFWRTCSGCHETCDGYDVGHYPHSKVFNCTVGSGCGDCGGLGVVWDNTDYEDMARFMEEQPEPSAAIVKRLAEIIEDGYARDATSGDIARAALAAMGRV